MSSEFKKMKELNLSINILKIDDNKIGVEGVKYLANSPFWAMNRMELSKFMSSQYQKKF